MIVFGHNIEAFTKRHSPHKYGQKIDLCGQNQIRLPFSGMELEISFQGPASLVVFYCKQSSSVLQSRKHIENQKEDKDEKVIGSSFKHGNCVDGDTDNDAYGGMGGRLKCHDQL
jgi:hypothetical protein